MYMYVTLQIIYYSTGIETGWMDSELVRAVPELGLIMFAMTTASCCLVYLAGYAATQSVIVYSCSHS